jgi:ribosomal protein S18 acetylase RimI-like enzyme
MPGPAPRAFRVVPVPADRAGEAAEVLAAAFEAYPVMRYVMGAAGTAYADRLRRFAEFAVAARHHRGELVLGVEDATTRLAGVATIVGPTPAAAPAALDVLRAALWEALGADALARYERHGAVVGRTRLEAPHYHLSMIGARPEAAGRGCARRLLDALHERSRLDPASDGVGLNTQDPANVPFYEYFGYRLIDRARVADAYDTWSFFRPDPAR